LPTGLQLVRLIENDAVEPGVILDYDAADNIVGIEVLKASRRTDNRSRTELLPA
jgi:uncharacterized protein YuzE